MASKMKREAAGRYRHTTNARTFLLENVRADLGLKADLWHVSEIVGGVAGAPFEAAETLREAKYRAEVAAGPNGRPLIEVL